METNFTQVSNWLAKCKIEPGQKSFSLQTGVHIEEFLEFLEEIEFVDCPFRQADLNISIDLLRRVATVLKKENALLLVKSRLAILDALCDTDVTGNGVAYTLGFNKNGADAEVLRSNNSKFEDGEPVIMPGGKIGKGRDYSEPDLTPFI